LEGATPDHGDGGRQVSCGAVLVDADDDEPAWLLGWVVMIEPPLGNAASLPRLKLGPCRATIRLPILTNQSRDFLGVMIFFGK